MNAEKRVEILSRLRTENPNPETELKYESVFELLISVILSAQATDVSVNKATKKLYAVANTPEAIAALGLVKLKSYVKTIGLYNTKADNIIKTCRILCTEHDSEVPRTREALEALPGVGRKTANVVLSMAFGVPTMAVDTHIFRIGNRLGLAPGKTPDDIEDILMRRIPPEFLFHAHHWLILHGRYTCKARKPECDKCIIADLCKAREKSCSIPAAIVPLAD